MIRTYPTPHGEPIFDSVRMRQRRVRRNRMMALAVIVAVAASAGVLQHFNDNLAPSGSAKPGMGAYSAAR